MNKAESAHIASYLEAEGYTATNDPHDADIIVLNTCVVRQSAEDKIIGHLGYLKGIKKEYPDKKIILTGCFVKDSKDSIQEQFPHIDLAFPPGAFQIMEDWIGNVCSSGIRKERDLLPAEYESPCAYLPIIQGCNNFCSYCIVPYRRGRERSRLEDDIVQEAEKLVDKGIKEITLLGQNVNSYGKDLSLENGLRDLLARLNSIPGLMRIRFLTNHPRDMNEPLIKAIASLEKVCEHINVPFQSGDNEILAKMHRHYSREHYFALIKTIRAYIPDIALSTDVIVGFPGETEEQFQQSVDMLRTIRFDNSHIAAYSVREGTIAARELEDNVPYDTKKERLALMESLQENISKEINERFLGQEVEILVEGKKKNKWFGRTRGDKLVFFESPDHYLGRLVHVKINKTSPWSLQGGLAAT